MTQKALDAIVEEFYKATAAHGPMASAHEGYAVILEELDELWNEIKTKVINQYDMQKEATQVAAMGMRFLVDVCGLEPPDG